MEPYQAYPLQWPVGRARTRLSAKRPSGNFRKGGRDVTVFEAASRVKKELDKFTRAGRPWVVDPDSVVISSNIPVRRDGIPYSNAAKPVDTGVAVYFKMHGEDHCLSCDGYMEVADNLAAIAKHIEAMRGMMRWCVADLRAVFAGYKALPGGDQSQAGAGQPAGAQSTMSVEIASGYLASFCNGMPANGPMESVAQLEAAYRVAAKRCHPDCGGSSEKWMELQRARLALDEYYGR